MESPAQQSTHVGRLGRWLPVIMVAAVVLALAALLAARAGIFTMHRLGEGSTSPNWQTYHDPDNLFTVQLPSRWTVHVELSTAGFGDRSVSVTETIEMITFENPSQGTGSAKLWVVAYPIKEASAHQYYCQVASELQAFTPMSLSSMAHSGAIRLFTTDTASFQVDVTIPGVLTPETFGNGPYAAPTPTPLPSSWVATDQTEVNQMLASFQPTDPKPFAC